MERKSGPFQETVCYEPGALFLFHYNFSTNSYSDHWHNAIEVVMPIENTYTVEVNYNPYVLNEYDILIVPSGELHKMNAPETKGRRIILQFSLEALNMIRGIISASYVYSKLRLITQENDPELHEAVKALLLEMLEEYLSRNLYFEMAILNKIIDITIKLARKEKAANEQQHQSTSKRKEQVERLSVCLDYINRRYKDDLTLEMAAQAVGFSKYHFARWFRELTGISFLEYLTKIRINKVEAMLLGTMLPITEVAMEAGFQSVITFNRIFKKAKNCTPSEYRYLQTHKQTALLSDSGESEDASGKASIIIKPPIPADLTGSAEWLAFYPADQDGAFSDLSIWADIPDPDVIRIDRTYYMVSAAMHFSPGIPVMKSQDLYHWEIVNYVYDILDDSDACALRGGAHAYGKGGGAASLGFRDGVFFVAVSSLHTDRTYIFQTENIENGRWRRYELGGVYHDPSLLFDDDGRVYLTYGAGTVRVIELTADATAILPNGMDRVIIEGANASGDGRLSSERSRLYKVNGRYYLFLTIRPPTESAGHAALCYRACHMEGPYESQAVLDGDAKDKWAEAALGSFVDTPDGSWYAVLSREHGAAGRVPVWIPVAWTMDWPICGGAGCIPRKMEWPPLPNGREGIVTSDEFYPNGIYREYGDDPPPGYQCGRIDYSENESEATGEELVLNHRFEDGSAHWDVMEIAEIHPAEDETRDDLPVLFVSGRITTASGPRQIITGKVRPGGVYEVSACVKYISGAPEKIFNISIRNGTTWKGIQIMGSGRLRVGEWGVIRGTYTLPRDADCSETSVFLETPWSERPKKERDLMDFYVEYLSVIAKPMPRRNRTAPGENDPRGSSPALAWQWNHNPDHNLWTLTERHSYLRLKSAYLNDGLLDARNTLTQRAFGPVCVGVTALETGNMKDGDFAGLAALQELYGYVGVKMVNGIKSVVMVSGTASRAQEVECRTLMRDRVYLRMEFDFQDANCARFYYSLNELNWYAIGTPLPLQCGLSRFAGYRFALFYYSTQVTGGHADFDYFRLCGELAENHETLELLNAFLSGDTEVIGMKNTALEVSVHMQALAECEGIYLSLPVPDLLDVADVSFCHDNLTGNAVYTVEGKRLRIAVTGDSVAFSNCLSDLFAVVRFKLNDYAAEDTVIDIRFDYLYVNGGNAVYRAADLCATINVKRLQTRAMAKLPGFANPLISHKNGGDPCALEYEGRLYLYLTGDKYEYDHRGRITENTGAKINTIHVISSADLLNWTDHGEINAAGANGAAKWAEHAWAPAVVRKYSNSEDQFYLYFANSTSGIGVLTAESPLGPWTDPIGSPLIHQGSPGAPDAVGCFDPAVLVDGDGSGYLYFGGGLPSPSQQDTPRPHTARVVRLGGDMISTAGEAVAIDAPALLGDSCIHERGGVYYYSYCSSLTGLRPQGYPPHSEIAYMTADHPMGPFAYQGTILKNPAALFGTGGDSHHCIFAFKGQWFIAYHAQTLEKAIGKGKGYRSPHINCLSYYGDGHIQPVTADRKGVTLPGTINPYAPTEAATFAWCAGIATESCFVTHIHDGDWLAVANADFGQHDALRFIARVSSRTGGEIELRLGGPDGERIGALGVGVTGGEDSWELRSCDVTAPAGVHDLFFVFRGDSDDPLFCFDSWFFEEMHGEA